MSLGPIRVFLFLGQSNIAGADAVIENGRAGFVQQEADQGSLFTYGPGPGDVTSTEYVPWESIRGHFVPSRAHPKGYVIGPEVGFCRQLFLAGHPLAVIKCCGNIAAAENDWLWEEGRSFYANSIRFAEERLAELGALGWDAKVAGVVWDQGIDDGFNELRCKAHPENLRNFISSIRRHFNDSSLPFVLSRSVFSPLANPDWMRAIRKSQVEVAQTTSFVNWIDIDDLERFMPHHMTAASQLEAGRRFAIAYQDVLQPSSLGSLIRRGKRNLWNFREK